MGDKAKIICALIVLSLMGIVMLLSVKDDTYTTDEGLYIPTGYLYLTERTMKLGFEHPPLMRDIAVLPYLFMNLKPASSFIPQSMPDLNGAVWEYGENFLFRQSVSPGALLLAARIPMILLTLLLGFLVFWLTKKHFGDKAGFIALFLFVFSPLVLGHGRLVTLDVPTALGAFMGIYFFFMFLKSPTWKNVLITGSIMGLVFLIKFSMLILLPFFALLTLIWFGLISKSVKEYFSDILELVPKALVCGLVALAVIYLVYGYHILNYSSAEQVADMTQVINYSRPQLQSSLPFLTALASFGPTRPLAEYVFGAMWQFSRTGAFGYLMGYGSGAGFLSFYPIGYFLKETLILHLFTLFAIGFGIYLGIKNKIFRGKFKVFKLWLTENFFLLASVLWIIVYSLVLIFLNKGNTGVRYVMPIMPFLFLLVGGAISTFVFEKKIKTWKIVLLTSLMLLEAVSVLRVYPSFLAYFNESIGGPDNGGSFLVDTDLDWGQDAKRLASWAEERGVESIQVPNVFYVNWDGYSIPSASGVYSASLPYYLKNKIVGLVPGTPAKGWIAIPARLLEWGDTKSIGKSGWSSNSYEWLSKYEPVAKIGYSIYVYHID